MIFSIQFYSFLVSTQKRGFVPNKQTYMQLEGG